MIRASTAIFLFAPLLLTSDESAWAKTKATIAIVVTDEGNVGVQSRVITGDDKETLTTDPQGKLEIKRSCNSGEVITASPIEAVVYYASTPINCQANLNIKVRRREFVDNAVLGYWKHAYIGVDGNPYSTGSIAQVKKTIEETTGTSGASGKCTVEIDPVITTVVWDQTASKLQYDGLPKIAKTYESDAAWDAIPRQFSFEGTCKESQQKINERLAEVYKVMIAEMKTQEVSGSEAISAELEKQGEARLIPAGTYEPGAIWTREVGAGQLYPQ